MKLKIYSEKVQVTDKRRNRRFLEDKEEDRRETCSSRFQLGSSGQDETIYLFKF